MATRLIEDGDWDTAQPTGTPVYTYPFEGDDATCFFDQLFQVKAESFVKAATSVEHATLAGFYLVSEGPQRDVGAGIVQWTRRYSKIPATRSEYQKFPYTFIGYYGVWGVNVTGVTGRDRWNESVRSRLDYEYFLVDPTLGGADAVAHKYTDVANIPVIAEQQYVNAAGIKIDWLADSPPFDSPTTPSRTTYEGWVSAGTWIVAEESDLRRWQGNIWERVTRYVKAK